MAVKIRVSIRVTTITQCALTLTAPCMGLGLDCTLTLLSRAQVIHCTNLILDKHCEINKGLEDVSLLGLVWQLAAFTLKKIKSPKYLLCISLCWKRIFFGRAKANYWHATTFRVQKCTNTWTGYLHLYWFLTEKQIMNTFHVSKKQYWHICTIAVQKKNPLLFGVL